MSSQGVQSSNPLFGNDKPDFTRLAGLGAAAIVAVSSPPAGQTAAITNGINFTPPAIVGLYRVTIMYRPTTTGASTSVGFTVAYKDSAGAQSLVTLPFKQLNTTALSVPAFGNTGATFFWTEHVFLIDNSATAITVSSTGTFTGTTYNFAAILERIT